MNLDRIWKYLLAIVLAVILGQGITSAQRTRRNRNRVETPQDTAAVVLPDSVIARHRADSIARRDSLDMLGKSSLELPAFSTAKDSIITEFTGGKRKVYYYGGATVTYQDMKLTADYIEYDMETNTVFARGRKDETTGEWVGQPEMTQGKSTYKMEELKYNFDSRKSVITNMITQESEGLLQGEKIKMMPDQSINLQKGMYTVCDLEHPHYYMKLSMAKVVTKPSQKTVFGPAYPVIADVPIPIGLPFGFVPSKPTRATGMLMPTFGEEVARGFFVKDAGMYFVLGDYFDLSLTGSYFTLGSYSVDINSRYRVNYKFNGGFSLTYSNDQTGEKGSADFVQSKNFGLRWTHTQDAKAHPGMTFSASVNFSSPSNSKYNSRSVDEALQNQVSSSVSFSRNWNGKVSLSVNALHNQNSRDSSYSFTLPNITLSVTRFYPFKQKNRVGKEKAYEKISFGYSTSFQNRLNFKMRDMQDFVMNPDGTHQVDPYTGVRVKEFGDSLGVKALNRLTNGMGHNFQIGLPNFTLLKYFNFTPSVTYGMNWMFNAGSQYLVDELDDDGNVLFHMEKGAKGVLTASQIAPGEENDLHIWVYGEKKALAWYQENPNYLRVFDQEAPEQVWKRGNPYVAAKSPAAGRCTRTPCGHPEAFLEAFANHYMNFTDTIRARELKKKPTALELDFPTVEDGVRGMKFVAAVVESSKKGNVWIKIK